MNFNISFANDFSFVLNVVLFLLWQYAFIVNLQYIKKLTQLPFSQKDRIYFLFGK